MNKEQKKDFVILQNLANQYERSSSVLGKGTLYNFIYVYMYKAIFKDDLILNKDFINLCAIYPISLMHLYNVISDDYKRNFLKHVSAYENVKKDIEAVKVLINKISKEIEKNESVLTN